MASSPFQAAPEPHRWIAGRTRHGADEGTLTDEVLDAGVELDKALPPLAEDIDILWY